MKGFSFFLEKKNGNGEKKYIAPSSIFFSCAGTVAPRKQIFASTRQPCRQPQLEQTELEPSLVPPLRHGQIRARLLMHIDVSGPHATTCHGDTAN
jgi:hypothetical protein